ncbi:hypothetical protein AYO20_08323 [Fonsecaea nubica]|uniref:Amidase domain-containing protein n=1 Tax=Fonsecaea nubica TaxID=856822 RepID=A0A178CN73_9EURO|nr:hypothetical protein AYO20_08323 [Fonsecaea nubica]OAL31268.1 hypothetical protein AYO20_08323 [Fonsecaea nubica]
MTRSVQAARRTNNLHRVGHLLLFELQDLKYVASHRLKVSRGSLISVLADVANLYGEKCPDSIGWPTKALLTILPRQFPEFPSKDGQQSYVDYVLQNDDVLQPEFLANILLLDGPGDPRGNAHSEHDLVRSYGSKILSLERWSHQMTLPVPGPYLIEDGSLWQVSRLYDDIQGAFMVAVEPPEAKKVDDTVYIPLRISGAQYQTLSIATPSRAARHSKGPLDGMRIAVKDMFDMNGLTTTLCNRAFYDINTPSTSTAVCVKRLVDAGAQVLGTTKISSMISREEPTEAIDYHAPFNPRADGYQSPAGSSSGSAAAIAAYDWLDLTIAEDTSGSGRRPAAANGCFQYRPTHDLVDLGGMWPTFLQFDTPVILSRDPTKFASVASLWCHLESTTGAGVTTRPACILYPQDYLPKDNEQHLEHLESFVNDLRTSINGTLDRVSIRQKWLDSPPEGCEGQDLEAYLSNVIVQTFYHEFYHSQASFRDRYVKKCGKEPYVNSFVKWRWNLGRGVTKEQHQEGLRRLEVYKSWFLNEVMGGPEKNSILVMPISEGVPNYRDHPPNPPTVQSGFDPLFLSPILGCPDLVIPIAQIPFESRITERQEQLPVCVNLLGVPGKDLDLINAATAVLDASGRPCAVRVGSEMF